MEALNSDSQLRKEYDAKWDSHYRFNFIDDDCVDKENCWIIYRDGAASNNKFEPTRE